MRVLSLEDTRAALPFGALIAALDAGFRAGAEVPLRHHHFMKTPGAADDVLLLMPAWQQAGWGGVKIVNVHPGNAGRGLPAIASSYILFDRLTGVHKLLLDGGELTARRTAAASALAAKRLARPESRKMLIVGAGRVGANLAWAYRAAFAIEEIEIWSRTAASAEALAVELRRGGLNARAVPDLEAAVKRAEIISCATLSRAPLIEGEWLQPGQHIDLIGSFTPEMREADDEVLARARIFLDTDHAMVESGDIAIPLASGAISKADIEGTLAGLCRDDLRPRASAEEITLFKGVGSAIEDLAAAVLAYESLTA
ncbi:ornithine cyclodeaminase family protein [Rhodobacter xanthinilyticus]|nr:ornithine cyclodeaminase family protein [Rhodobacter xanthinilyticus]